MGCGGSKDSGEKGVSKKNGSVIPYDRRPKISVRIGPQVKKLESGPRIVFIFGGPGSRKGRIVDDLINSYGFQFLCGEDLIFQDLPKKVSNIMKLETIKDIKNLLEEDPSHITLEWMLQCIERRMEQFRDTSTTFLIDLIPNLRYLLRIEGISKNSLTSLEQFEEKYPVSFGLNLAIPVDKVLKSKNYCATPDLNGSKMKESGGQSDEADSSRTQKRAAIYEQCTQPFLNYFAKTERLVTVDVACGMADLIWHRVHETLLDLDFHPGRVVNTVVLFGWSDADINEINIEKYLMERIDLRKIVDSPTDDVDKQLLRLSQHIDNQSRESDSFVVSLEGTTITENRVIQQTTDDVSLLTKHWWEKKKVGNKPITFVEVEEGYLETYLPGSPKNCTPQPGSRRLKAICTLENEVYLFPPSTDTKAACNIATCLATTRHI